MPSPQGANEVGALNIGVNVDLSGVTAGLDEAKKKTGEMGEEIEGSSKKAVDGGIDPLEKGIIGVTTAMAAGIATAVAYSKAMDELGNQISKVWKDLQMLNEAMTQADRLQQRGFATAEKRLDRATAGANPAEREEMQNLLSDAEDKATRGRALQNEGINDRFTWSGKVSLGLERLTGGLWTSQGTQDISRGNDLTREAKAEFDKLNAMENRLLSQRGSGGIYADEAEARGLDVPPGLRTAGASLSPAAAEATRTALHGMSDAQFRMAYEASKGWQAQQDMALQMQRQQRTGVATQGQ
jgi:hypothetical protein